MRFHFKNHKFRTDFGSKFAKSFAPLAGLAMAAALGGCDANVRINGDEGVPLSELDMTGDPPTSIAFIAPDRVEVSTGDKLTIEVEGSDAARDRMRFTLDGDTLGIMREDGRTSDKDIATVLVTLPTLSEVSVLGSGTIKAEALSGDADVTIGGSGMLDAAKIEATKLSVNILGSGSMSGAGTAETLDLTVAGSGSSDLAGVKVEKADISVLGSGSSVFASDGEVDASIMGSGSVTVRGSAKCTVSAMGSGKLVCERAEDDKEAA